MHNKNTKTKTNRERSEELFELTMKNFPNSLMTDIKPQI